MPMKYRDTGEMRQYLDDLLTEIHEGKISNASARVRVQVAKAMLDTVKIEIAALAIGQPLQTVSLEKRDGVVARRLKSVAA